MPERLTEAEEAAIRERLSKSTPGPWQPYCRDAGKDFERNDYFLGFEVEGPPPAQRGQFERGADAIFIAHAREDIPRLLATLEAERARAAAAVAFRRKLHMVGGWLYATLLMVSAQFGVHEEQKNAEPLAAWRALTRGEAGTDGE